MTQAHIDLQNQLEQVSSSDLTTRLLFNASPVLFIDTSDQVNNTLPEQKGQVEQIEHDTSKVPTLLHHRDNTHATPLHPKTRYEIMKDPVFFASPIYPPTIPSKPSLSTNRDDHIISRIGLTMA